MATEHDFYGPPGSGKTRHLIKIMKSAVARYGPTNVAFATFTRTAAEEARERAAQALGITGSDRTLRVRLPYVGTVHALAYRLCGVTPEQMVKTAKIKEFCADEHINDPRGRDTDYESEQPYIEMPTNAGEIEYVRLLLSSAAHRMIEPSEALEYLPAEDVAKLGGERLLYLAGRFVAWKQVRKLYDYDDMLIVGRTIPLPVGAIILDEAQDQSALLWSVVDAWAAGPTVKQLIVAGDHYQALFSFMGADPDLFLRRTGQRKTIGNSYRFGPRTAQFCREILVDGFGAEADALMATWQGVGGQPKDGSHLYLARTNKLLDYYTTRFHEDGTPYRKYRGLAPLQQKCADAYRALHSLRSGSGATIADLKTIAGQTGGSYLERGVMANLERMAKAAGTTDVSAADAERLLGRVDLRRVQTVLPHAPYFDDVLANHGLRGLLMEPSVIVSTIHGAKGREADNVTLIRSWAWKPGQSLSDPYAARSEVCCAYVACSRHRVSLEILDIPGRGIDFFFPGDGVSEG